MPTLPQRRFEDAEYERCRTAAHLYFNGDFTQEQIAAYLGISRPWVSRLLKRARDLGIVTIVVEPPTQRPVALERVLARALGVNRCLIASSSRLTETASLAASYLGDTLRDGDVLAATVNAFEPRRSCRVAALRRADRRHQRCAPGDRCRSARPLARSEANAPFSQWSDVFVDPAMTLAAIDRLVHHATILEMNDESQRRRSAQQKQTRQPAGKK